MHNRHVTHLLTHYVNGQLSPGQRAHVVNHVRRCAACRAALAREDRLAADLRREVPAIGQASASQVASLWANVWQDFSAPAHPARAFSSMWLPGLSLVLATMLVLTVALPLLAENGVRAEAAPVQARPVSTASPTPGSAETGEARQANIVFAANSLVEPQATVAYAPYAGATPAPVPALTVSPEAWQSGARWR